MAAQLDAAAGESPVAGRSPSLDTAQVDDAPIQAPIQERQTQETAL